MRHKQRMKFFVNFRPLEVRIRRPVIACADVYSLKCEASYIGIRCSNLTVVATTANAWAESKGVLPGDQLVEVNGVHLLNLDEAERKAQFKKKTTYQNHI